MIAQLLGKHCVLGQEQGDLEDKGWGKNLLCSHS